MLNLLLAMMAPLQGILILLPHELHQQTADFHPSHAELVPSPAGSQDVVWVGESQREARQALASIQGMTPAEAMVLLAKRYLGRPYTTFSLDQYERERLALDLTSFDCFLFVEQILALANSDTLRDFSDNVKALRYREGKVDYCERQHYFSSWADAAERDKFIVNITSALPRSKTRNRMLNYMSEHASAYPKLSVPRNRQCIDALEQDLRVRQAYLPVDNLAQAIPLLQAGDLFALVTTIEGLDVTHVGIIESNLDGGSAIHAVPGDGVIRSRGLKRYFSSIPDLQGIAIYRPLQRRN